MAVNKGVRFVTYSDNSACLISRLTVSTPVFIVGKFRTTDLGFALALFSDHFYIIEKRVNEE